MARTQTVAARWFSLLALAGVLAASNRVEAEPVLYSTSGDFTLPSGTVSITGMTNADPQSVLGMGTVPTGPIVTSGLVDSPFHLEFTFNNGLPPIDVTGAVRSITYDTDWPIVNSVVTTSATSAQIPLYPTNFQNLIAHPDWLHSTSFYSPYSPLPTMPVMLSVHPEDPHEIRPVPEPSTLALFATTLVGLAWRATKRRQV